MSANICKKYYYMYTAFAARVTHLAVAQILHARRLDARGTPGVLRRGHRPALRRAPPLKPPSPGPVHVSGAFSTQHFLNNLRI